MRHPASASICRRPDLRQAAQALLQQGLRPTPGRTPQYSWKSAGDLRRKWNRMEQESNPTTAGYRDWARPALQRTCSRLDRSGNGQSISATRAHTADMRIASLPSITATLEQVFKFGELTHERQPDDAG